MSHSQPCKANRLADSSGLGLLCNVPSTALHLALHGRGRNANMKMRYLNQSMLAKGYDVENIICERNTTL